MKTYLILKNILNAFIMNIVLVVGLYFLREKFVVTPLLLLAIVIGLFILYILKAIYNEKFWSYTYDEEKIWYRKGFFTVTEVTIPMIRVQQIVTINNPILRKMNLVIVSIVTTTNSHKLLPISIVEKDEINSFITEVLKKTEETNDDE